MSYDSLMRKIKTGSNNEIIFSQADYDAEIAEAIKNATEKMVSLEDFQKLSKEHKKVLEKTNTEWALKLKAKDQSYGLKTAMQGVKAKKGYEALLEKLIEKDKIQYDENGNVTGGFDDQIKNLRESYADIFESEEQQHTTPIKGATFVNTQTTSSPQQFGGGLRGALAEVFNKQ